ncbi:hypothetical protein T439DRAFT_327595 [Meredithblackwellia eburnea MCA 4105]
MRSTSGAHNHLEPAHDNTTETKIDPTRSPTSPKLRLPSVSEMLLGVGTAPPSQHPGSSGQPALNADVRSRQSPSETYKSEDEHLIVEEDNSAITSPPGKQESPPPLAPPIASSSIVLPPTSTPSGDSPSQKRRPPRKPDGEPRAPPRRFPCLVPGCGKTLARPSALKTHMRIHSKEKPFVCPVSWCGRGFSVYSNMVRHQRLCNHPTPISGEEPLPPPPSSSSKKALQKARSSISIDPSTSDGPLQPTSNRNTVQNGSRRARRRVSTVDEEETMDASGEEKEAEGEEDVRMDTDERARSVSSSWASTSTSTEAPSQPLPSSSRHSLLALLSDAAALTPSGTGST